MLTAIATGAMIWFCVHWCYVLAMSAKDAYSAGKLTPYWMVMLLPAIVAGVLLDFAFNYCFGLMFLAKPRRYLFSQTVQHHYTHGEGWRLKLAQFWAKNLRVFDAEHIK